MLIGIDWGGTKIEGIALTDEGKEIARLREETPRHDYEGCIEVIVSLVNHTEQVTGKTGSVGIGIPGSLEPRSRLGKGASSTWLIGRPSSEICALPLVARSALRMTPIPWLRPRRPMERAQASTLCLRLFWAAAREPVLRLAEGLTTGQTTVQVNGATILCLFRMLQRSRDLLVFAASMAVWHPGSQGVLSKPTMLVTPRTN